MAGLLARKLGMTQIFTQDGQCIAVTILKAGPCTVIQKKDTSSDGYDAIQVGFEEIEFRKLNGPSKGHFQKKNQKAFRVLKEFRLDSSVYELGQAITVNSFQVGDVVDVSGQSKGKGFQGVIKRHHKKGGPRTHGSCFHRSTGSIGQRTYPGKVFKNMKLPGQMGSEKVTVRNLEVVQIRPDQNLLFVSGSVPGANNTLLIVNNRANEYLERKEGVA